MLLRTIRTLALAFLAVFAATCVTRAEEPTWPYDGDAFARTPAEMQAAAARVPAEPFAEVTVLFERDAYVIDATGRTTYRHTYVFRLETQAGVDSWSEIRLHWAPWYQNPPEIRARVIAADGKVTTLDPKTITDGPAREDSEDTYTDARVRKVPLPAVAVGAIVEEETVSADKQPYFTAGGVYQDGYWRDVPTVRAELRIDLPAALKFRYEVMNLPDAKVRNEVEGETRHFALDQGYLPGRPDSDISLSTHLFGGPTVRFSTGESWAAVARTYSQMAEPNIDPEKVKHLLPHPAGNRMETIRQIVARLHKEVRYTGIEFGQAALQPATAPEILKRHYGDCKDKAALLVAMLRAAGIKAQLALLDAGPGADVSDDLPGISHFDHAIAYLPPEGADPALWIDATAEYTQVGVLPWMDSGRKALIVDPATTQLTETPAAMAENNHLTEQREFKMAEYGPASIAETSVTQGDVDADYRSYYGGQLTREQKESLEKYAKSAYMAKALDSITHADPHDLAKPFALRLEMKSARRGNTGLDEALVSIPFSEIFARLPEWFRTDPKTEGEKLTPQQEENHKRAIAQRLKEYDARPLITEWQYTIAPPEGFSLRVLPENKTTAMGPATFSQHYETDAQGRLLATLKFTNPKPRITADEALALRQAVLDTYKQDAISIWFDQAGAKLATEGKMREALEAGRALIARHPKESLHHAQIAAVYLKAGLGDRARKEAEEATRLDPHSPVGFRVLAEVCEYNRIGVQFARGFDLECTLNAFKKALDLEPDDSETAVNLALLEEYDREGERYGAAARLKDAVAGLRALKERDKETGERYQDNILFDLYYSGAYKELDGELAKVGSTPSRLALAISSTVAQQGGAKGVAAGLERADRLFANASQRTSALANAGNQLLRRQLYPEAAGILSAAVEGQQDSAATAQQIAVFKQLTPWKGEYLPASDPRSVVERLYFAYMSGDIDEAKLSELLSRHAYGSEAEWRRNLDRALLTRGLLHATASRNSLPGRVLMDVFSGNLKLSAQGDDSTGHRVTVESLGSKPRQYFVTREGAAYRVVTDGSNGSEAGNEVLYLLKENRIAEARSLLDWMRDRIHKGGGDDPLSGPLFPRFWTVGQNADPAAMQLAAACLVADNSSIVELIPTIRAAWEKSTADEARLNLAMLLAWGYKYAGDGAHMKEIAGGILARYPDSYRALSLMGSAYELLGEFDAWKQMLDAQLARHDGDETLIRQKSYYLEAKGDWAGSRTVRQALFDNGKATFEDYNMFAWTALFDGAINDETVKAARQATTMTHESSYGELHTLACLYAYQGKTAEARDLLLKAMAAANISEPDSAIWFGFGRIYEQYGVNEAAIEAYSKVEKPTGHIDPSSTYLLAQARLKALQTLAAAK